MDPPEPNEQSAPTFPPATMEEYFRDLDHEFINIDKVEDETFHYKATDVLVQSTWELPLIIQWPGSKINFEFSTQRGDIQFGIVFVAALEDNQNQDDVEVETIEEMSRHRSDIEPIVGSFEPPCEGVVFFLWDNTYDWSAVKNLSYSVEVFQPSFTVPDADRCYIARNQLYDVLEDLETAYIRRADEEDRIDHLGPNVDIMEDQLQRLQLELDARVRALEEAEQEEEDMLDVLDHNYWILPGLGIRCLNKHLMSVMVGYLDLNGGVNLVSKYWAKLAEESRQQITSGPEPVVHQKPTKIRWVPRKKPSNKSDESADGGLAHVNASGAAAGAGGGSIPPEKLEEALSSATKRQSRTASNVSTGSSATRASEGTIQTTTKSAAASVAPPSTVLGKTTAATAGSSSSTGLAAAVAANTSSVNVNVPVSKIASPTANAAVEAAAAASAAADAAILRKATHAPNSASHTSSPSVSRQKEPLRSGDAAISAMVSGASLISSSNITAPTTAANTPTAAAAAATVASAANTNASVGGGAHHPQIDKTASMDSEQMGAIFQPGGLPDKDLEDADGTAEKNLLVHIKSVKSEQQLVALIEYIQAGYDKIERLDNDKRFIKKQLKSWNAAFEQRNGRAPTNRERKTLARDMYEAYQQVSANLKVRCDKVNRTLDTVGLTHQGFLRLRDKYIEWQAQARARVTADGSVAAAVNSSASPNGK